MPCSCQSEKAAEGGKGVSLAPAFAAVWPASSPFPPRAPWLAAWMSRQQAMALAGDAAATLLPRMIAPTSGSGIDVGPMGAPGDGCPDCPDLECFTTGRLPESAAQWYSAGGLFRDAVDILYRMLAEEYCASDICNDRLNGQGIRLYDFAGCEVQCVQIEWSSLHEIGVGWGHGWVYRFTCCCIGVDLEPNRPPEFDPPTDDHTASDL